jgi:aryl-alcohol dehydrogenase-like predicted oxidoreductase
LKHRLLGNSGLRESEFALGTMTFGEAIGNLIDTANVYTNGTNESFLSEFMQGHRQSVVLATKYTNAAPGTNSRRWAPTILQLIR